MVGPLTRRKTASFHLNLEIWQSNSSTVLPHGPALSYFHCAPGRARYPRRRSMSPPYATQNEVVRVMEPRRLQLNGPLALGHGGSSSVRRSVKQRGVATTAATTTDVASGGRFGYEGGERRRARGRGAARGRCRLGRGTARRPELQARAPTRGNFIAKAGRGAIPSWAGQAVRRGGSLASFSIATLPPSENAKARWCSWARPRGGLVLSTFAGTSEGASRVKNGEC